MQLLFFYETISFIIYVIAALTFMAVLWIHLDAWIAQVKRFRIFLSIVGWFLLAISFFLQGIQLDSAVFATTVLNRYESISLYILYIRLLGYLCVGLSVILDPLMEEPHHRKNSKKNSTPATKSSPITTTQTPAPKTQKPSTTSSGLDDGPVLSIFPVFFSSIQAYIALPLGALLVAYGYFRRATTGLERHLKPLAYTFGVLFFYEIVSLAKLFRNTSNPSLYRLVAAYGPFWIAEHALLLIGSLFLLRWVGQYLLRRLKTQLIMIFVSMSVGIFAVTTLSFTTYLLQYMQFATLERLHSDGKTLEFVLGTKEKETRFTAEFVAQNSYIQEVITNPDRYGEINPFIRNILLSKGQSSLLVTDKEGKIIAKGENPDQIGTSLSDNVLISRAIKGETVSSLVVTDGAVAPVMWIRAATPIKVGEDVVGTVMTGSILDNAFVDGIKEATNLDVALYATDTLAASTITTQDGSNRWVGIKETNEDIKNNVLMKGESFKTTTDILGTSYLVSYIPLKDIEGTTIGMLFVGIPQLDVLKTAGQSLQLTFITTTILMMFSLLPSYVFARKISLQVR